MSGPRAASPVVVQAADADLLAELTAQRLAGELHRAVSTRGRATLAASGGSTPWPAYRFLAGLPVPWEAVELLQVDERVAPAGDPARNAVGLTDNLCGPAGLAPRQVHFMPVEPPDPQAYTSTLLELAGDPPVVDLVVLGLGTDGHIASLVPGDPVLDSEVPVATTLPYQGHARLTLTLPVLRAARRLVMVVSGAEKRDSVRRLLRADPDLPAATLPFDRLVVFADAQALG